jgi:chromate transporter
LGVAAPTVIVSLIGWKAAGIPGALIATAALFLPSCLLVWLVATEFETAKKTPWRTALELGLSPVALGLIFAAGIIIAEASDHGIVAYLITGITTILLVKTDINPLTIVGVAGLIGLLGFV